MKSIFAILALAASALAQGINIGSPTAGQSIVAGSGAEVIVERGDSMETSTEIGIAILIHHCTQNPCEDATQQLGEIFYAGAFNPQRGAPGTGSGDGEPFQSFFASVPTDFPKGPAVLSVAHSALAGLGPSFLNEIVNVTINIS